MAISTSFLKHPDESNKYIIITYHFCNRCEDTDIPGWKGEYVWAVSSIQLADEAYMYRFLFLRCALISWFKYIAGVHDIFVKYVLACHELTPWTRHKHAVYTHANHPHYPYIVPVINKCIEQLSSDMITLRLTAFPSWGSWHSIYCAPITRSICPNTNAFSHITLLLPKQWCSLESLQQWIMPCRMRMCNGVQLWNTGRRCMVMKIYMFIVGLSSCVEWIVQLHPWTSPGIGT